MPLDQAQLRAVRHRDGPMLVLAGPGSGKTTVIVNRILFLTGECRVPAEEILVITFTKAAALEMQERCRKKLSEQDTPEPSEGFPVFGTFHSYFFSVLRRYCGFSSKSLIQTKAQYEILKKILQDPQIPMIYTDDVAEVLLAEISRAKNNGGFPSESETERDEQALSAVIYRRYNTILRHMKLLDFDDMLLLCRNLFLERPECLSEEQRRFSYFLVDEFQDINALQYEILRLLAGQRNNLFIVGDDDQSIYGFRGSRPSIMLGFAKNYPGCRTVLLSKNYRSGTPIVDASARLIAHNRTRFRKQITAGRELPASVLFQTCRDEREELEQVFALLEAYRKRGIPLSEIAVLYRTNTEAAVLRTCFAKAGIAFSEAGKRTEKKAGSAEPVSGSVRLATFHSSKGLEFTAVIIIGASEGITPHRRSDSGALLEEERRMFYVAVTRAKQYLHILDTKSRYNKPQKCSRFAEEMRNVSRLHFHAERRIKNGETKNTGGRR